MSTICPYCRSDDLRHGTHVAALLAAIDVGDLDAAIELGLVQFKPHAGAPCAGCRNAIERVIAARDERRTALAARERYRQRNARLEQRAHARAAKRLANAPTAGDPSKPALPAAAAAALARAKAKAAARK